jgi:hypothetical protein
MRTCKLSFIARGRLIEVRGEDCRNELERAPISYTFRRFASCSSNHQINLFIEKGGGFDFSVAG